MFHDRKQAGQALAARLSGIDAASTVILALPRGGVPVAYEIAAVSGAPLDLMLVRKVGVPGHTELAVGAIADTGGEILVVNDDVARSVGLDGAGVRELAKPEQIELERRRRLYLGDRQPVALKDKTAILVDDGIATGATMRAAVRAVRARGAKRVVVAVPVAPQDTIDTLRGEVDAVVCLEVPEPFWAVAAYYELFPQVSDAEVKAALASLP